MATNTKTVNTTSGTYDSGLNVAQNWIEVPPAGTGANIFAIQDNTLSASIKVLGTGDTIYIEGNFADYQYKQNGKTITLDNGIARVALTLSSMTNKVQVTTTLVFLDGSVTLTNGRASTRVSINGFDDNDNARSQVLSSTYKAVIINANDSNTAAATYFSTTEAAALVDQQNQVLFTAALQVYEAAHAETQVARAAAIAADNDYDLVAAAVIDAQSASVAEAQAGISIEASLRFEAAAANELLVAAELTRLAGLTTSTVDNALAVVATNQANAAVDESALATEYAIINEAAAADVVAGYPDPATTFALTTGVDAFVGAVDGDNTFNATDVTAGQTWTAFDSITATGTDNVFNVASSSNITNPVASVVTGVQTMNVYEAGAAGSVTLNTTAFTGLSDLNVINYGTGGELLTAAATTNVALTALTQGAGDITIDGGNAVTVTAAATDAAAVLALGDVYIGSTTVPTGAVLATVTNTISNAALTSTLGDITITGGAGVTVNSTVNATVAVAVNSGATTAGEAAAITVAPTSGAVVVNSTTNVTDIGAAVTVNSSEINVTGGSSIAVTQTASTIQTATAVSTVALGAVNVTGDATTTTVTVNQTAAATGALAVTTAIAAVTGVATVSAVTATQGVTGVTAAGTNAVTAVAVKTGTATVTNGAVAIADKNAASTTVANTIAAVTLSNYGTSTISSTALSTLTLSGPAATGGTLAITLGGSAATVAAHTALTLNLGGGKLGVITEATATNQIATVNAVLTASTTLAGITDTALRTLAVTGTGVLTLSATNTALTSVTVAGAAGFSGTIVGTGVTAFTAANTTGNNTVTLSAATQSYAGGAGVDTVTISADATKAITGGAGTTDKLILGAQTTLTAANTGANVTGFEILGVAAGVTAVNMATLSSGFTSLQTIGNGSVVFTNVAADTGLTLGAATTSTTYTLASTGGSTKAVTVNLGTATSDTVNFGTLVLNDLNANGIGTVSLVSNGVNITAGDAVANYNTIATLTDANIATLNVSGTQGLLLGSTSYTNGKQDFTINNTNTSSYGLNVPVLIDSALENLTFTGTGKTVIGEINDSTANITISNTGTGAVQIADINNNAGTASTTLTTLNLEGNIQLGNGGNYMTGTVSYVEIDTTSAAVSVNGATNNAGVNLLIDGANTNTTTVTLGNGNNTVKTLGTVGGGTITTGSGLDFLYAGNSSSAAGYTINAGAGADTIIGGNSYSATKLTTIIGGLDNDFIQNVRDTAYSGTVSLYDGVSFTGNASTGSAITTTNASGVTWSGTLYAESTDVITSTGINQTFATLFAGNLVNTAGAGKIFAGANIVSTIHAGGVVAGSIITGGAIEVASTAKDVFLFQTNISTATYGAEIGVANVEQFKIGQDIIAVTNYQGSGDNLFVGSASAAASINAVTAGEALLASANGWSWTLDSGSTTSGTLSYVGDIGGANDQYANMSIHMVGVQGTIAGVDSFFYQG